VAAEKGRFDENVTILRQALCKSGRSFPRRLKSGVFQASNTAPSTIASNAFLAFRMQSDANDLIENAFDKPATGRATLKAKHPLTAKMRKQDHRAPFPDNSMMVGGRHFYAVAVGNLASLTNIGDDAQKNTPAGKGFSQASSRS